MAIVGIVFLGCREDDGFSMALAIVEGGIDIPGTIYLFGTNHGVGAGSLESSLNAASWMVDGSENKLAWVLKGEAEQKNKHWSKAIDSFKHAWDIDSTYVPAAYNIGKCYFDDAKQLKDSLQGSKLRFRKTDDIKYRELLQNAKKWIVEASILDPKQDIVEWKQMLEYINKVIR